MGIRNWFKKRKSKTQHSENMQIVVIDQKAPSIADGMAISKSRQIELEHYVRMAFWSSNDAFYILEQITAKCNHVNEVTFVVMEFCRTRMALHMSNRKNKYYL